LYAATKKSNELMAHSYSHLFGLPTTGLRFFTVYGPWGRPDMALFKFTKAILERLPIEIFNHGKMIRDFTYVDDIVEGIVRVLDKPAMSDQEFNSDNPNPSTSDAPYRIFNIGNNQPIPLLNYIESLEKALGIEAQKCYLPMQPGDVPATSADAEALNNWINFRPNTSTDVGVDSFVDWYLKYYATNKETR
jgi:UDP-glucuronate 4-epimerase